MSIRSWMRGSLYPHGHPAHERAAFHGALLLGVLILVLVTMVTVSWLGRRSINAAVESDRWVAHTQVVIGALRDLLSAVKDAEIGERGYIITGDRRYLTRYAASLRRVEEGQGALRRLTADNPRQKSSLDRAAGLISARLAELEKAIAVREAKGFEAARISVATNNGFEIMEDLREVLGRARKEEESLLRERTAAKSADYRDTIRAVLLGGALSGLALLVLAGYLRFELLHRLRSEAELRESRDILTHRTEQLQKANTELLQTTKELTQSNSELDAFSASVAHDLRAPIRHILGYATLLVEDYGTSLDEEARRRLLKIQAGARNMGLLVDDLLDLSKVTRQTAALEVVPLGALAREVVEEFKPDIASRDVDWRLGELFEARCDPTLVKQVFENLLSNALKYTRRCARAVIEIGATTTESGERAVYVRDNGAGFDMRHADKLFGIFQRLHPEREFEGTGVGLALVERIVRKHGGRVWAYAEPEKGAAFFFTLEPPPEVKGAL
jgi:signal transduction histidine kinase